jgi:glycosyltransferase involved in cell wall biosynthesis
MREDMAKFYKASDFLIVSLIDKPIFSVTVPAKTQTYIAARKPILAIINGDVADIVNNNNLGISADPSNVCLIKEAFQKCIDMPENEKSKFTINNTKLLETIFNKDSIINKMTSQLVGCNN